MSTESMIDMTGSVPAPPDRLRAAYDSMFDPHVLFVPVHGADGTVEDLVVVDANAPVSDAVGIPREQMIGRRVRELFPEHIADPLIGRGVAALERAEPTNLVDVPSLFDPSAQRRVDIRGVRVGDALSVTWRDVTERHRYRLLAELSSDVVFRNHIDGSVEWVSPSVTAAMGWRPDQIVGHSSLEFVHPDDHETLYAAQAALEAGRAVRYEARFVSAAGEPRWMAVVAQPLLGEDGTVVARIGSMRVIDDQVAAREALVRAKERAEELNRRLEAFLDLGAIIAYRVDPHGVIRDVTPSVRSVLGFEPEQLIGTDARTWIHPSDIPAASQAVWSLQPGERQETRTRISDSTGTYRQLAGTIMRSADPDTGADGFEIVVVDVTEQARAAKAREQLGAMASQEIRGPLAVIYGGLDMFESGRVSLDDQRGRDLLRRMSGAAKRLTGVVESWGKVQRADAAPAPAALPEIDVRTVIHQVVASMPTDQGVHIVVDDRATDGLVRSIDPEQISEAVTNVLANAIRHSPADGQVDLIIEALAGGMRVVVRDRGPDSPTRNRREPADHFALVTQDSRDLVVGRGLAVAAAIAVAHAGRLTAEDPADGTGVQFVLELHEARSGS